MKHAGARTLMPPMVSGESAFTHFFEVLCSAWQFPLVTRTVERELRRSTPRGAQKSSYSGSCRYFVYTARASVVTCAVGQSGQPFAV